MSFEVVGGDFGKGGGYFGSRTITLPTGQWGRKQEVSTSLLRSVELISQETIQKNPNRFAWGIGGAVLMGPIGLLTGLLPRGSTKSKVAFIATFADGRSFLGTTDQKTFLKIKAASLGSDRGGAEFVADTVPSYPMPGLEEAHAAYLALESGEEVELSPQVTAENVAEKFKSNGWAIASSSANAFGTPLIYATNGYSKAAILACDRNIDDKITDEIRITIDQNPQCIIYIVAQSVEMEITGNIEDCYNAEAVFVPFEDLDFVLSG